MHEEQQKTANKLLYISSEQVFRLTSPFIDWGEDVMESVYSVPAQEFCKSGGVLSLLPHCIPPEDGIHCLWTVWQLLAHGAEITKKKAGIPPRTLQ